MIYKIGDEINVTVSVVNNSGSTAASNVTVSTPLSELVGLAYSTYSATQGTYSSEEWDVGTLDAGATESITFVMVVEDDCVDTFGPMTCEVDIEDSNLLNNVIVKTVTGGTSCCEVVDCVLTHIDEIQRTEFGLIIDNDITLGEDHLFKLTEVDAGHDIEIPCDELVAGDWIELYQTGGDFAITASCGTILGHTVSLGIGTIIRIICLDDTTGANVFLVTSTVPLEGTGGTGGTV